MITGALFAAYASRIAGVAGSWAADTLMRADARHPVDVEAVARFRDQVIGLLNSIDREAAANAFLGVEAAIKSLDGVMYVVWQKGAAAHTRVTVGVERRMLANGAAVSADIKRILEAHRLTGSFDVVLAALVP